MILPWEEEYEIRYAWWWRFFRKKEPDPIEEAKTTWKNWDTSNHDR